MSSPMTKLIIKDFRLPENRIFEIEDSAFLMRIPFVIFSQRKMPKDSGSVHHYHHDDEQNDFSRKFVLTIPVVKNCWKLQKVFPEKDDEVVFDEDENY